MKKKKIIVIIFFVLIILLVPIPMHLQDGGTVKYKSLTYKISKVHRLNTNSKTGYEDGLIIEILGIKVYDNVFVDISDTNEKNKVEYNKVNEVTWEEITTDGVNEELLLKNVDEEILTQIATELQTLVKEEQEEEKENPEIVITEGFVRVFKSERYKKVLNMGEAAMKPLYLILYKSPNAGLYEYICANALYELSGYDFEWANSKEFMENFNKKIIENRQ